MDAQPPMSLRLSARASSNQKSQIATGITLGVMALFVITMCWWCKWIDRRAAAVERHYRNQRLEGTQWASRDRGNGIRRLGDFSGDPDGELGGAIRSGRNTSVDAEPYNWDATTRLPSTLPIAHFYTRNYARPLSFEYSASNSTLAGATRLLELSNAIPVDSQAMIPVPPPTSALQTFEPDTTNDLPRYEHRRGDILLGAGGPVERPPPVYRTTATTSTDHIDNTAPSPSVPGPVYAVTDPNVPNGANGISSPSRI